jgi:vancomycin aglycone glucosyltransferase
MRALLVPIGTRGVTDPMLALALALRDRGHEVRVCGPENEAVRFGAAGVPFRATSSDFEQFLKGEGTRAIKNPIKIVEIAGRFFRKEARRQFEILQEYAAEADVIVGGGTALMGSSVAEAHGIPYRHVIHFPTIFPSRQTAPPVTIFWQTQPSWLKRLGWWVSEKVFFHTIGAAINDCRRELGLAPIRSITDYSTADVIVAVDEVLGPVPDDVRVPYRRCAYPHLPDRSPLAPELERFLERGAPPVYIGFGSMSDPHPEATRVMLTALARKSRHRFIVAAGWARLGEGLGSDNVLSIGATNFSSLFPRVAGVVHHGGPGTVSCAARAGVPQLLIPHALDQFFWAQRIATLQLGPRAIPRKQLTADNLVAGVEALIARSEYAVQARAHAARMRQRDGLESLVAELEALQPAPSSALATRARA